HDSSGSDSRVAEDNIVASIGDQIHQLGVVESSGVHIECSSIDESRCIENLCVSSRTNLVIQVHVLSILSFSASEWLMTT
ncbi:hypothetical protein PENTCL1PPCAC_12283, partial [Pristionchus entomophagus]